jgi:two-component system response regulator MprA
MLAHRAVTPDAPHRSVGPVLVVDDDAEVRAVIREALEREGLAVTTSASGVEALELAARWRPGVVVLEMAMPEDDGANVAAALRALHGPTLPIVVLTAYGSAREKVRRVGAQADFVKPFRLQDLLAAVRTGLGDGPQDMLTHASRPAYAVEPAAVRAFKP